MTARPGLLEAEMKKGGSGAPGLLLDQNIPICTVSGRRELDPTAARNGG